MRGLKRTSVLIKAGTYFLSKTRRVAEEEETITAAHGDWEPDDISHIKCYDLNKWLLVVVMEANCTIRSHGASIHQRNKIQSAHERRVD